MAVGLHVSDPRFSCLLTIGLWALVDWLAKSQKPMAKRQELTALTAPHELREHPFPQTLQFVDVHVHGHCPFVFHSKAITTDATDVVGPESEFRGPRYEGIHTCRADQHSRRKLSEQVRADLHAGRRAHLGTDGRPPLCPEAALRQGDDKSTFAQIMGRLEDPVGDQTRDQVLERPLFFQIDIGPS